MRPIHWLAVTALLAFVVAAVLLWRGCSGGGGGAASDAGVELVSPDVKLELVEVRATPREGYTDWACIFECSDRAGCRADVELEVRYRTAEGESVLTVAGRLDAARGERMRIGRAQRSALEVVDVESVSVRVAAELRPDGPPPTPML